MSYYDNDVYSYLNQLHAYLKAQNKKIERLEKTVAVLQDELNKLKQEPRYNIESMEYRFDQLKVEKLEGTLNIGITPNGSGSIEEYIVDDKRKEDITLPIERQYDALLAEIHEEIDTFLDGEAFNSINQLEKKYQVSLDQSYHRLIIEDIKKQIDERINYYINDNKTSFDESNQSKIKDDIVMKVKKDVYFAIDSFIKNVPREEK